MTTSRTGGMNQRMIAFAHAVASGKTQTEAYRIAAPNAAKWKDSTVWAKASRLASDPRVEDLIAKLREKAAQATIFTLHDHLKNLHDISIKALAAKDFNAAARAEEARGRAAGFYVQRLEHTGKDGGPIESKQTRDLTDDELNDELVRHGIDPDSIKPRTPGATH